GVAEAAECEFALQPRLRARQRIAEAGLRHAEVIVADVSAHPFAQNDFELAFSRFGVMFFSDPQAAFANVRRAMKPGRPTVKQHLAAIRMLFDWLVVGQVLAINPAHAVRGPKHVVKRGKTPVLTEEQARRLLESIKVIKKVTLPDGSEGEGPWLVGL